jgi:hypothetical protein
MVGAVMLEKKIDLPGSGQVSERIYVNFSPGTVISTGRPEVYFRRAPGKVKL